MDALQRRVRRLERLNYGLIGLCMLTWLLGAGQRVARFDAIECKSLRVVDRAGNAVIKLDQSGAKDTPALSITKDDYKSGMIFGYSNFGEPMLQIADQSKAELRLGRNNGKMELGLYDNAKTLIARFPSAK